jgi:hypothetical protein
VAADLQWDRTWTLIQDAVESQAWFCDTSWEALHRHILPCFLEVLASRIYFVKGQPSRTWNNNWGQINRCWAWLKFEFAVSFHHLKLSWRSWMTAQSRAYLVIFTSLNLSSERFSEGFKHEGPLALWLVMVQLQLLSGPSPVFGASNVLRPFNSISSWRRLHLRMLKFVDMCSLYLRTSELWEHHSKHSLHVKGIIMHIRSLSETWPSTPTCCNFWYWGCPAACSQAHSATIQISPASTEMWQELWRSTATGKQTQPLQASLNVSASTLSASIVGMRWSLLMWHKDMQCYHHNAGTQCSQMSGTTSRQRRGHLKHPSQNKRIRIPVMIQSQSSEGSKRQNTGIKKTTYFLQKCISMVGWIFFFDPFFSITQRGDRNALARHSTKASNKKCSRQKSTLMLGLDCHLEQLSKIWIHFGLV